MGRALAAKLAEFWGQPVTVENVTGAGATAGPARVAKSPADGYTLLINTSAQAYSATILRHLPYDPLGDFIPIAPLTSQPYVLVAGRPAGIMTVADLIAAAKAHPGVLRFGSSGVGTGTHLGLVKLNLAAGILAEHVPPGATDAIGDVIARTVAGGTAYMLAPITLALPEIREGKLVPLGVSHRSALLLAARCAHDCRSRCAGLRTSDLVRRVGTGWDSFTSGGEAREGHRACGGCPGLT